ncbi:MAG: hypothetical protein H7A23_23145 [Leptospiraceae bacterium]|nr:hypothetical protein [Leptospiraceae bacterium]MCP5497463.1 hypothetical protein [Leptospiraceae bacterium]
MEKDYSIYVTTQPTWSFVSAVRDKVKEELKEYDKEIVESGEIAASELIENAIKYGVSSEDAPVVEFKFKNENKKIEICVVNGIESIGSIHTLIAFMEKIKNVTNKQELYIERLREILEQPTHTRSQLGLYRILYETEFDLTYEVKGNKLTVWAIRIIN